MRAMIALNPVRARPSSLLPLWIVVLFALLLGAPAAGATPLSDPTALTMAQQTGGSFGGSRWGSGSSSSGSSSGGSWSGGGGGHSSSDGSGFDLVVAFIELLVWCFSVSPVLGFAVLGVGAVFLVVVFAMRK